MEMPGEKFLKITGIIYNRHLRKIKKKRYYPK